MKKRLLSGFLWVLMLIVSCTNLWADNTRIAVVSQGNAPDAVVSPVAARGLYFLIFDARGTFIEAVENPHRNAGRNASEQVVVDLSNRGVTTLIAGNFGNKMTAALTARRIRHVEFQGTAADAVRKAVP
jgi:predicted Fe-Mo cluster-binding NifX family protein